MRELVIELHDLEQNVELVEATLARLTENRGYVALSTDGQRLQPSGLRDVNGSVVIRVACPSLLR